jgi:hypothetical protein
MLLVRASSSDVSCRHLTVMRRGVPRSGETTAKDLLRRRRVHDEIVMDIIESFDVTSVQMRITLYAAAHRRIATARVARCARHLRRHDGIPLSNG